MKWWHEWRGQSEEKPALLIRHILRIPVWRKDGKWYSIRADIHKICHADQKECFHSHPAWSIRIVLWGGYIEENLTDNWGRKLDYRRMWSWYAPSIGIIAPNFAHRISSVEPNTFTLWIRGPIVAPVNLIGSGWGKEGPVFNEK